MTHEPSIVSRGCTKVSALELASPPARSHPSARLQEASKQLKVLQTELGSFVEEGAANQHKREAAEGR